MKMTFVPFESDGVRVAHSNSSAYFAHCTVCSSLLSKVFVSSESTRGVLENQHDHGILVRVPTARVYDVQHECTYIASEGANKGHLDHSELLFTSGTSPGADYRRQVKHARDGRVDLNLKIVTSTNHSGVEIEWPKSNQGGER